MNQGESYIFVRITSWQNHRDELFSRVILYPHKMIGGEIDVTEPFKSYGS